MVEGGQSAGMRRGCVLSRRAAGGALGRRAASIAEAVRGRVRSAAHECGQLAQSGNACGRGRRGFGRVVRRGRGCCPNACKAPLHVCLQFAGESMSGPSPMDQYRPALDGTTRPDHVVRMVVDGLIESLRWRCLRVYESIEFF